MNKHRSLRGILLLLLWTASVSVFSVSIGKRPEVVTMQLQWKHQFQFAGYYAAIHKGYYRDAGLDVRLLELDDSTNSVDAVASGKAQFGSGSTNLLYWQHQKADFVVLASIFQHSARTFIVSQQSGIRHVDDMVDKRVVMEPNCLELEVFLLSEGVRLKHLNQNFNTDHIQLLKEGKVDVVSGYTSNEPIHLEDAAIDYRLFTPAMAGVDFYGDILYTTKDYLTKHPEVVARFRKASLQGWAYAMDHPKEIVDLIYDQYSQANSKEDLMEEAEHLSPLIMKDVVEIGYSNPLRWKYILGISQEYGLVDKSIKLKGLLYSDYERQPTSIPWKLLGIIGVVFLASFILLAIYFRIIQKLRAEIRQRQLVQDELVASEKQYRELNANLEVHIQERTEELAATNRHLMEEVEVRTQAEIQMNLARQEAEKANVAKSEFLSRMSHELRTPMNSILGFAQLLEMGDLNASQRKSVGHIIRSGRHLLDLINEVLDISRIESGRLALSLESVSLHEILVEMADVVRPQAQEKQIRIHLPETPGEPLFLYADRQRLKQVLLNLLNNAVKYNRPEGSVEIRSAIRVQENGLGFVRVSVSDTGPGISDEDLARIFTPFERIGADKTAVEGTGLGLSVVKKLMEAMGGSVGVESTLNEGSTFWIEMSKDVNPLMRSENAPFLNEYSEEMSPSSAVILYVEDNQANIELLDQVIVHQRPGYRLHAITDGLQAIEKALEIQADIILLDMNLPDIHGLEVLKMLQNDERTREIPVLVISADAMPNQVTNAYQAGAQKYLAKPLDISELLSTVDDFVKPKNS
jgi:signal transduction histidine kinase/CheY-like chemotaxis protein